MDKWRQVEDSLSCLTFLVLILPSSRSNEGFRTPNFLGDTLSGIPKRPRRDWKIPSRIGAVEVPDLATTGARRTPIFGALDIEDVSDYLPLFVRTHES